MATICYTVTIASMALFFAGVFGEGGWETATATFYGDIGGGTSGGACGYGDPVKEGYGVETTALSSSLYNNGEACGACFEVQCYNTPHWCQHGSVHVTATNLCPPGGVCSPPNKHFDLSEPMFRKIAKIEAGIINVQYRRVPCVKTGGVKFELKGNPSFLLVLIYNVGGTGDISSVNIKGSKTGWLPMMRNWGENWQINASFLGQSLSFQVKTSDGKMVQSDNVAPSNWQFGQTYEGKQF
ncbi:expansin-A23-like [Aristolochia californica]|uniref:expansin-A23-like n=1 Tax=Aristolochia californica TaxID=171875 RepID=UPI0035E2E73B